MRTTDERERFAAASVAATLFIYYAGYEVLRSANSTMFNASCGAHMLSLGAAVALPATLAATVAMSALVERVGTTVALYCSVSATIAIFGAIALNGDTSCRVVLVSYCVREAYVVLIGAHIWAHLNTWLDESATARLLGPVEGVAAIGGTLGGLGVAQLGAAGHPSAVCAWAAACSLCGAAALLRGAIGVLGEPAPARKPAAGTRSEVSTSLAQQLLVLSCRPELRACFAIVMLMQVASGNLLIALQTTLSTGAGLARRLSAEEQLRANGYVNGANNLFAAAAQFTLTPLLLRRLSPGAIHGWLAAANLVASAVALCAPSLATVAGAYVLLKSTGYSVAASAFEMLYTRMGFHERFHGKAFISSVAYRAGKGSTFLVVPALRGVLALAAPSTAAALPLLRMHQFLATGAALGWLAASVALWRCDESGGVVDVRGGDGRGRHTGKQKKQKQK
eukprot:g3824.t1